MATAPVSSMNMEMQHLLANSAGAAQATKEIAQWPAFKEAEKSGALKPGELQELLDKKMNFKNYPAFKENVANFKNMIRQIKNIGTQEKRELNQMLDSIDKAPDVTKIANAEKRTAILNTIATSSMYTLGGIFLVINACTKNFSYSLGPIFMIVGGVWQNMCAAIDLHAALAEETRIKKELNEDKENFQQQLAILDAKKEDCFKAMHKCEEHIKLMFTYINNPSVDATTIGINMNLWVSCRREAGAAVREYMRQIEFLKKELEDIKRRAETNRASVMARKKNAKGGLVGSIVSGTMAVGALIAAPFTGGATIPLIVSGIAGVGLGTAGCIVNGITINVTKRTIECIDNVLQDYERFARILKAHEAQGRVFIKQLSDFDGQIRRLAKEMEVQGPLHKVRRRVERTKKAIQGEQELGADADEDEIEAHVMLLKRSIKKLPEAEQAQHYVWMENVGVSG